jgi:hypothetical protein
MVYEINTIETSNGMKDFVTIYHSDTFAETFPVDEANPSYKQFLEETT